MRNRMSFFLSDWPERWKFATFFWPPCVCSSSSFECSLSLTSGILHNMRKPPLKVIWETGVQEEALLINYWRTESERRWKNCWTKVLSFSQRKLKRSLPKLGSRVISGNIPLYVWMPFSFSNSCKANFPSQKVHLKLLMAFNHTQTFLWQATFCT